VAVTQARFDQLAKSGEKEPGTIQLGLWLTPDDDKYINKLVWDLRQAGWRGVRRSAIVRALMLAVREAAATRPIDLRDVTTEDQLNDAFRGLVRP
jgi:hypothetical protein